MTGLADALRAIRQDSATWLGGTRVQDWTSVIVALIAAVAALTGYLVNSRMNRVNDKTKAYAEALAAVEHYKLLPDTIYKLHDSTAETRAQLAKMIVETQESLAFHRRWLDLDSPIVGSAYNRLVDKVRETNSAYRRQAFDAPPPDSDSDLENFRGKFYSNSETERAECVMAMRCELKLFRRPVRVRPTESSSWYLSGYGQKKSSEGSSQFRD
jgi:hypothetical protein